MAVGGLAALGVLVYVSAGFYLRPPMSQSSQKKSKGKTNKADDDDDDDDFLEQCIKSNEICSLDTCDKSIKLIRLKCEFCHKHFCTSHVLPEIHGCGQAARKAASAPAKKPPNAEKMQDLEKKMSARLDRMQRERKKKGK